MSKDDCYTLFFNLYSGGASSREITLARIDARDSLSDTEVRDAEDKAFNDFLERDILPLQGNF